MRTSEARPRAAVAIAAALLALAVGVALVLTRGGDEPAPVDWSALPAVAPQIPASAPEPSSAAVAEVIADLDVCRIARTAQLAEQEDDYGRRLALGRKAITQARDADRAFCQVSNGALFEASLERTWASLDGAERFAAAGRAVWRSYTPISCVLTMPVGTQASLTVSMNNATAQACQEWEPVASTILEKRPALAALLYPADGPDPLGVGACRQTFRQAERRCAPARPRAVSSAGVQAVRQGEADADVVCTAARAAVGAGSVPADAQVATVDIDGDLDLLEAAASSGQRACVLTTPTGVEVAIASTRAPADQILVPETAAESEQRIGGHRAVRRETKDDLRMAISLRRPGDRGTVLILARSRDLSSAADSGLPGWIDEVAEIVARRLLG